MIILVCVALLLLLWIVCYHLSILSLPKPIVYQYATLVLITFVQPLIIYFLIWRNYHSSNTLSERLEMEFTREQIMIRGESFYLEMLLNKLFKIVEEPNWFLLYQNNLSAIIIPKKDLNEQQKADFKTLLLSVKGIPVLLKK